MLHRFLKEIFNRTGEAKKVILAMDAVVLILTGGIACTKGEEEEGTRIGGHRLRMLTSNKQMAGFKIVI